MMVPMSDVSVFEPKLTLIDVDVQRGDFILCQGVNLTLQAGEICHLVGENGLGKTTLLHQITGLLPTQTGQINTQAPPVYISHQLGISKDLTVAQNLRFLLALYGAKSDNDTLDVALDAVGLYGLANTSSAQLSAGQTRRIGLAKLFVLDVCHSDLWLLDEPLTALDVSMVTKIETRMQDFAKAGGAIVATSHQTMQGANKHLDLTEFAV